MKTTFRILLCSVTVCLFSCNKNDTPAEPVQLNASVTSGIHISQPVDFTLPSVAAGTKVDWSVATSGSGQSNIKQNGNAATISFLSAGKYTVTGTAGTVTGTSTVSVDSVNYLPPNGSTTQPFIKYEILSITAVRNDSTPTASGLTFQMQTINSYSCQNSSLAFSSSSGNGSFNITVTGISVPLSGCVSGTAKPSGTTSTRASLPAGTTNLTIVFNGTTYTGTIVKTGNSYVINWNYTKGVIISPPSL